MSPTDKKFFVSYSRQDRQAAEALCRALRKRDVPYWIDKNDIAPGSKFRGEIVDAIDQSAGLILLLSENSNRSEWVEREVACAVAKGKRLFPVRIADVEPSKELVLQISVLETVDLLERPFKSQQLDRLANALLKTLRAEIGVPASEPDAMTASEPAAQKAHQAPKAPAKLKPLKRESSLWFAGRLILGALAFAAACGSAWWADNKVADNDPGSVTAQRLFSTAMAYQYFVTFSPFHLEPGNVFVIEISDKDKVSDRNTCQERGFIGDLLGSLALDPPAVVVIDKYFEDVQCDGGTGKLLAGVRQLCQAKTKVVVGRGVNEDALKTEMKQYPLDAALDFRKAGAACVSEGVLNLDPDFRRVSLRFPNVQPVANSSSAPPSLPLAAALAYRPDLKAGAWPPEMEPPYISFLTPAQFDKFKRNASHVLGGAVNGLRGKVVLIGELDHRDQHQTVLGEIDGYLLQANYIESLLANRVFRPVPQLVDWLGGLAVFFCFEILLWRFNGPRLLVRVLILAAGVVLAVYLSVNLAGYYFNPAPVGIVAVLYVRAIDFVLVRLVGLQMFSVPRHSRR